MEANEQTVDLAALDLAQLATFVGQRADAWVLSRLHAQGFAGVRVSHGYVIQHVVGAARSISEIAERMGVTQQGASKAVRELVELDYLELHPGEDARLRVVSLSARGKLLLASARRVRSELTRKLLRGQDEASVAHAKGVLAIALERLGGLEAVRTRKVPEPR